MRLTRTEELLEGREADPTLIAGAIEESTADLPWRGREGMSSAFGAHLARVILGDALAAALDSARGSNPADRNGSEAAPADGRKT